MAATWRSSSQLSALFLRALRNLYGVPFFERDVLRMYIWQSIILTCGHILIRAKIGGVLAIYIIKRPRPQHGYRWLNETQRLSL
ncbi:hypothetical protein BJX62DRAFT_205791 [Aspergillus germanicus]